MTYRPVARARLPLPGAPAAEMVAYEDGAGAGGPIYVVVNRRRRRRHGAEMADVRLHSACLSGDALGSARCDCGPQLAAARRLVAISAFGVLVYVPDHEGRGIGATAKLQAYALQDTGLDTFAANESLGHPADGRDFLSAALVCWDVGVRRARVLTRNPAKVAALRAVGIDISDVVLLDIAPTPASARYLSAKFARFAAWA